MVSLSLPVCLSLSLSSEGNVHFKVTIHGRGGCHGTSMVTSQFIPLVSLVKCGEDEESKTSTLMLCVCMCVCVCVCMSEVKDGPNKSQYHEHAIHCLVLP